MATCVQHITFADTTPPVITCPADKVPTRRSSAHPADTGSATATDNCGGTPAISHTDAATPATSTGKDGIYGTERATDVCGNESTCVQHISFADSTPPVIACAADKVLACGDSTDPADTGSARSEERRVGKEGRTRTAAAPPAKCTDKAGLNRTWKATDACRSPHTC